MATRFTGFPEAALEFFEDLEMNNNREWFHAHKAVYEAACRGPMLALLAELEPEFGPGRVFRIQRDTRFSLDKSPYKTNVAAVVGGRHYVSLQSDGFYVGSGAYMLDGPDLARFRQAVADDRSGPLLEKVVTALEKKGYGMGAHDELKTAPKGYPRDHPRVRLLRMKGIHGGRSFAPEPWLATRSALTRTTKVLRDLKPLNDWLDAHLGA